MNDSLFLNERGREIGEKGAIDHRGNLYSQAATVHHCRGCTSWCECSLWDITSPWRCLWWSDICCWQPLPSLVWWHCAWLPQDGWSRSCWMSAFCPKLGFAEKLLLLGLCSHCQMWQVRSFKGQHWGLKAQCTSSPQTKSSSNIQAGQ